MVLRCWRDGIVLMGRNLSLVWVLFCCVGGFSLVPGLLYFGELHDLTSRDPAAASLTGPLDYLWYSQIEATAGAFFKALGRLQWLSVAGFVACWLFLLGGVLSQLAGALYRARGFLSACQRSFPAIGSLFAWAALGYGSIAYLHQRASNGVTTLTETWDGEWAALAVGLSTYVVALLLVCLVTLVLRYAQIRAVLRPEDSVFASLEWAWRFVRRHLLIVLGVHAAGVAAGLLVLVAFCWLNNAIEPQSLPAILGVIASAQILVWLRAALRTAAAGAELSLCRAFGEVASSVR